MHNAQDVAHSWHALTQYKAPEALSGVNSAKANLTHFNILKIYEEKCHASRCNNWLNMK